jgi:hypothetical protein
VLKNKFVEARVNGKGELVSLIYQGRQLVPEGGNGNRIRCGLLETLQHKFKEQIGKGIDCPCSSVQLQRLETQLTGLPSFTLSI